MKQSDKDFIACFSIACFVSMLFYYVNRNCVGSYLGYYCLLFGIIFPFCLPLGVMIKTRLESANKC